MSSQLRPFFLSVLQVILITAVLVGALFVGIKPDPTHYFAGSLLQTRLLEDTPSPRIILIGGSNVAFGLDAEMMQKALGIPVINDGLHAGLGVVPLRELEGYIHKDDKIIISLEYSMFASRDIMEGDPAFLSDWIEYAPQRINYLSNPWKDAPGLYATMLQRKINRALNTYLFGGSLGESRRIFNGSKFNANGDFIGHLQEVSLSRKKIPTVPYSVTDPQEDIFIFLAQFNQFAREKGAQVYFAAPASRQSNCKATGEQAMANFLKVVQERVSIPVLTPIEDVCLPDKYFFDTAYHLNAKGREIRTQRLIEDWISVTAASK